MSFSNLIQKLQELGLDYGVTFLTSFIIFIFGFWLARFISRMTEKAMLKANVDVTLATFTKNIVYAIIMIFMTLAVLARLGIQTASFVAVLGAAGLAISLALQGTLANVASGVLLILFRPFKIGDSIKVVGFEGTVKEIQIFATILHSTDNKKIIIPNAKITGDIIVNETIQ
ncbi:MAG TPA: mechanosensitive ion channel [Candidatus Wallbacteria bacterium]|nr:mechanosensitive ion channel [Candidatus Wallbacteria bacterium]